MNEINERKIISDEHNSEFSYNENKSNIKISFERSRASFSLITNKAAFFLLSGSFKSIGAFWFFKFHFSAT